MNLCEKLIESNKDILQIKTGDILTYYRSITERKNTKVLPLLSLMFFLRVSGKGACSK